MAPCSCGFPCLTFSVFSVAFTRMQSINIHIHSPRYTKHCMRAFSQPWNKLLSQKSKYQTNKQAMGNHGKTSLISHLYPSHLLSVHTPHPCVQPRQPLGVKKGKEPSPNFSCPSLSPTKGSQHASQGRSTIAVSPKLLPQSTSTRLNAFNKHWFRCSRSLGRTPRT